MEIYNLLKAELNKSSEQIEVEKCFDIITKLQNERGLGLKHIWKKFFSAKIRTFDTFKRYVEGVAEERMLLEVEAVPKAKPAEVKKVAEGESAFKI